METKTALKFDIVVLEEKIKFAEEALLKAWNGFTHIKNQLTPRADELEFRGLYEVARDCRNQTSKDLQKLKGLM